MQSLTLIQRDVEDRERGWIQVKVEPSAVIRGGLSGIYVDELPPVSTGQPS
jgi:hypothetical protein